jgi:glycosyltransferase involved in cell wall biosynthesis
LRSPEARDPVVILACPGLDHAVRGFETFGRECFEALRGRPGIAIELVKGSGRRRALERTVATLQRDSRLARVLGGLLHREAFVIEHLTFSLALIPLVARKRPDVVYFSEWHVGRVLALWRQLTREGFKLVMCNGSFAAGPYPHLDHVQQLFPAALENVTARGVPPDNQSVLPLGVAMAPAWQPATPAEISHLRRRLGLPMQRRVIVSVGALNAQKRHEYVIGELASLPEPRPFLLMVGQPERETPAIAARAAQLLGEDGHRILTVSRDEMPDIYRASDLFVLASLQESFGRALIEALSHGLPCLTHDYAAMRWIMGDHGVTGNLGEPHGLVRLLAGVTEHDYSAEARQARHASVYERFSWDRLAPRYVDLLRACAFGEGSRRSRGIDVHPRSAESG